MIIYESSGYRLLLHWYGSVLFTSLQAALVAAVINVGLALWFRHNPYSHEFRDVFPSAAVYTPVSLGIAFVLVFRCSQAYARFTEATSHCFQMRSQLGNACMQLHSTTKRTDDWEEFHRRHRRLSYAFQRAAMQELRGEHDLQKLRKLTTLLPEEAEALSRCPNRPLRIMHWMSLSVSERWDEGGFRCPPPVLARTYLHLTDAMNAYNAAWKIARTPFPFPYAQLSLAFLVVMQLTVPVVMLVFIEDMLCSAILSGLAAWMFFSLHAVAVELENPFGYDWNDLPLDWYSAEVLDDIRTIYSSDSPGDVVPWHKNDDNSAEQCSQSLPESGAVAAAPAPMAALAQRGAATLNGPDDEQLVQILQDVEGVEGVETATSATPTAQRNRNRQISLMHAAQGDEDNAGDVVQGFERAREVWQHHDTHSGPTWRASRATAAAQGRDRSTQQLIGTGQRKSAASLLDLAEKATILNLQARMDFLRKREKKLKGYLH